MNLATHSLRFLRWPALVYKLLVLLRRSFFEQRNQQTTLLRDFWSLLNHPDTTKNFLVNLVDSCKVLDQTVYIESVFPELPARAKSFLLKIEKSWRPEFSYSKIWYSPENKRPPYADDFNAFLGFDNDSSTVEQLGFT